MRRRRSLRGACYRSFPLRCGGVYKTSSSTASPRKLYERRHASINSLRELAHKHWHSGRSLYRFKKLSSHLNQGRSCRKEKKKHGAVLVRKEDQKVPDMVQAAPLLQYIERDESLNICVLSVCVCVCVESENAKCVCMWIAGRFAVGHCTASHCIGLYKGVKL